MIRPKTTCTVVVPQETDQISSKSQKRLGVPNGFELEPDTSVATEVGLSPPELRRSSCLTLQTPQNTPRVGHTVLPSVYGTLIYATVSQNYYQSSGIGAGVPGTEHVGKLPCRWASAIDGMPSSQFSSVVTPPSTKAKWIGTVTKKLRMLLRMPLRRRFLGPFVSHAQ
jgi:hypothetical protein